MEGGLEDLTVEESVAGAMVPQPEEDRRPPLLKRPQPRRGDIRGRRALAVAVERDAVVGPVDRRHVDRLPGWRCFRRGLEVVRSDEAAAPGDPFPRLPFAEHDRIEITVGAVFDRDRCSALLVEIRQHHPGLEGLLPDRFRNRITFEERLDLLVESEPSRHDLGAPVEFSAGRLGAIPERPADQRRRAGGECDTMIGALGGPSGPFLLQIGNRRSFGGDRLGAGRGLSLADGDLDRGSDRPLPVLDTVEDRLDAEVVLLGHRVELVAMTAGAVERQAEEGLADDADHVLHLLLTRVGTLRGVGLGVAGPVPGAADEHARGNNAVAGHRFEDVAGELFLHETVVGLVVVEAPDDVVAVVPSPVAWMVVFKSLALGIADDVEPVPSPAFAVVGRGEELVDEPSPGDIGGIGHEGIDLLGARRQPDQIDEQAPDEDVGIGGAGGGEAGSPEPLEHPGIDRATRPRITRCVRERRFPERLERPPVPAGTLLRAEGEGVERRLPPGAPGLEPSP